MASTPHRVMAAIVRRENTVLLVEQQDADGGPVNWALPGGRVHPGEPLVAALYREMREETGLRVTSVGELAWAVEVRTQHGQDVLTLVYEADVGPGEPAPEDPDNFIRSARFVPVERAIDLIGSTVPWRSMSEPVIAYLRGVAEPGLNWFYRSDSEGNEILEMTLDLDDRPRLT